MVEISIVNQVYISVEAIVAFLSVFGNILVCYVVLKTERLRKKVSCCLMFRMNLTGFDTLVLFNFEFYSSLAKQSNVKTLR